MPLSDLLDELFRLYRRHFSLIVGVALLVALPGLVWTLVTGNYRLTSSSFATIFTTTPGAQPSFNSQQFSNLAGAYTLAALALLVLSPITVGAVTRAVTDVALGRPASIGSVLRETVTRYFPLLGFIAIAFGLFVVWVIAFVIGLALIVLPGLAVLCGGVYFAVRWSMSVPAMMAEDIGPIKGMSRSWNLVKGQWWRSFGVILIVLIMRFIIGIALGFMYGLIVGAVTTGDVRLAVVAVGTTILSALISPIVTIALVLLYFDLRVRKEGLDLDQLAQQTSPGPAPA
jgi:Membrane domain of glycerophosphoryl diester phosphodiesterase